MRYNIFFPNGIDLTILPNKGRKSEFLTTLASDAKVVKKDVLVSEFLQMVSMDLTAAELAVLQSNPSVIIETPQQLELLASITINGETGWEYPNQWTDLIGGIDYFYNNPNANPSTHNYNANPNAITGEIINSQVSKYKLDALWQRGFKGNAIKVAVLDTGCAIGQHPDVAIAGGVNVSDASLSYTDTIGHGTAMASIIAGRKNGSGVVGFAPLADVYSVKVVGVFGGNPIYGISDSLLAGLEWCFYNDIQVINISLNWGGYSAAAQLAINKLVKKNVFVCCAAGNNLWNATPTSVVYPAGYNGVFTIGGKRGGIIFEFTENLVYTSTLAASVTGKGIDYLLESWLIEAKIDGSGGKAGVGTSESSASFAGIAAVLKQRFPYHSPNQIRRFLNRHTTTGTHGYKYFENFDFIKGRAIAT